MAITTKRRTTLNLDEILVEILRYVILPLFKDQLYKETFDYQECIGEFFNVDTREIYHGKTLEDLRLPGNVYVTLTQLNPSWGNRNWKKGHGFLLRVDSKDAFIELEHSPRSGYEEIFKLSHAEFDQIKHKITLVHKFKNGINLTQRNKVIEHHTKYLKHFLNFEGITFESSRTTSGAIKKR